MNDAPSTAPHYNHRPASTECCLASGIRIEGKELRAGSIRAVTLLETRLAVGRDDAGRAFALVDLCPHRAMPLSFGRVAGTTVECCYTGGNSTATRAMSDIPSLTADANVKVERIFAGSYPCEERTARSGFIFRMRACAERAHTAAAPELPTFSAKFKRMHHAWSSFRRDQGVLGLLDRRMSLRAPILVLAVSQKQRDKEKTFERFPTASGWCRMRLRPIQRLTKYWAFMAAGDDTIDFVLPNHRTETIRCGKLWFVNRTVVTPLRRDRCRLDFGGVESVLLVRCDADISRFAERFIAQDQRIWIGRLWGSGRIAGWSATMLVAMRTGSALVF